MLLLLPACRLPTSQDTLTSSRVDLTCRHLQEYRVHIADLMDVLMLAKTDPGAFRAVSQKAAVEKMLATYKGTLKNLSYKPCKGLPDMLTEEGWLGWWPEYCCNNPLVICHKKPRQPKDPNQKECCICFPFLPEQPKCCGCFSMYCFENCYCTSCCCAPGECCTPGGACGMCHPECMQGCLVSCCLGSPCGKCATKCVPKKCFSCCCACPEHKGGDGGGCCGGCCGGKMSKKEPKPKEVKGCHFLGHHCTCFCCAGLFGMCCSNETIYKVKEADGVKVIVKSDVVVPKSKKMKR